MTTTPAPEATLPTAAAPVPPRAAARPGPPPRPRLRVMLGSTVGSVAALLLLVAVGTVLHQPLLIPPLAASMALVAGAPDLPLSQPRSVVGGQLLSALTGFAVLALAGPGFWSAAVAGGLALGVMMAARTPHSPAAATAVIVALQSPPFWAFIGLLALASALLVAVGLGAARVTGRTYPAYWI
ncbi:MULTISPECIES: HPP family protein [unclassified Streptomyces]|uniref:HPP family protein n=1 Tax=unclassified Streptomyces TaxID=2593676 RepID=UPI0006FD6A29|nr:MULTISPECIES: HPP family protein [unclassified Streptomyces]KQX52914.1 HPP family protein+B94 [Streptomyces sp. Root1304]KRA89831.1 HPP family protein+B94 [Streptomyces sp. Root66D1]